MNQKSALKLKMLLVYFILFFWIERKGSAAFYTLPPNKSGDEALIAKLAEIPEREAPAPDSWWYQRYHFHYDPDLVQDLKTGRIIINLFYVKQHVLPALSALGIHPDEMLLEVNGGKDFGGEDVPLDFSILAEVPRPYAIFQGGPANRQQYVRVVLKEKGRYVHVVDSALIEKRGFPRIDPHSYAQYPEASLKVPSYFERRSGMDTDLVRFSGVTQHHQVVWSVARGSKNIALKKAFDIDGPDLSPLAITDKKGELKGWKIKVPGSARSKEIRVGPDDILVKGGAAFNQHSFFWDDHYLAEARANSDPRLAINTLMYWMLAQKPDGAIGRELDYKGQPYQRFQDIKYGKSYPNLEFFNPPLEGWAWHEVLRWSPTETARYLPKVLEALHIHRLWFLKEAAVYDQDGKLLGFNWSNHGSGRDNSPRPIDELGVSAYPKYGDPSDAAPNRSKRGLAVDLLAQYKLLLDGEREFSEILGRFDEATAAAAESVEIAELLNRRYFNPELGWYVDIVPTGEKDWRPSRAVTLAGFWAVAAKAASAERISTLIHNYLENPDRFGGPILPSLPRDNPYYDEGGHYWRGGGWPPDWEMVMRALYESGFRAEASLLAQKLMGSITVASNGYALGDTPEFMVKWVDAKPTAGSEADYQRVHGRIAEYFKKFWSGELYNPEAPGSGTVFEFYGLRRDEDHHPVPTYGQEIIEAAGDYVHTTRAGFAGWGVLIPFRCIHYFAGFDAVPRFLGQERERSSWLKALLSDPALAYQEVGHVPAFKGLSDFLRSKPEASLSEFDEKLSQSRNKEFDSQLNLLREGYLVLSPTFDPISGQTEFKNYTYDGEPLDIRLDRDPNGDVRITLKSDKKIRAQFNRRWVDVAYDSKPSDLPFDSSPIFTIGGDQPQVILRKGKIIPDISEL